MLHARTGRKLCLEPFKWRRCRPGTGRMNCIISQEAHRKYPPSLSRLAACSCVECQHMKADDIARFYFPTDNGKFVSLRIYVRQLSETSFGKPFGLFVSERSRHEPGSFVRAGDELQSRSSGNRIGRDPHAAILLSFDVVVRL